MRSKLHGAQFLVAIAAFLVGAGACADPPATGPRSPGVELAAFELADPALRI